MIIPFILITFKLNSGVKLVEGTSWENCSTTGLLFRDWTYEKNRSHHQDKKILEDSNLLPPREDLRQSYLDKLLDWRELWRFGDRYKYMFIDLANILLIFGKSPIPSSFCLNELNTKRYYRYKLPLKRIFVSLPVVHIHDFHIFTVINHSDFSFQVIHCTQSRKLSSPG